MLMDRQERRDHAEELMILAQQLADLVAELFADRAREQKPIFLDQAADLVLDIPANGHKPGSRDEYRADFLTFLALDLYLSIPTDPHQFGQTPSVILIALVHAHRQSRVRMPSVDADHRKIDPTQFMP